MNAERIVADFETSKKAAEIGLELDTVFEHRIHKEGSKTVGLVSERPFGGGLFGCLFFAPAPTAEEVSLPPYGTTFKMGTGHYGININAVGVKFDVQSYGGKYYHHEVVVKDKINEATARLKMAIWLIENVPEGKQWYMEKEYLNEAMFKAWQEANHERD